MSLYNFVKYLIFPFLMHEQLAMRVFLDLIFAQTIFSKIHSPKLFFKIQYLQTYFLL